MTIVNSDFLERNSLSLSLSFRDNRGSLDRCTPPATIIDLANEAFQSPIRADIKVQYVNEVFEVLLKTAGLEQYAARSTKQGFFDSEQFQIALLNATKQLHEELSHLVTEAECSPSTFVKLKEIFAGPGKLYEKLRGAVELQ